MEQVHALKIGVRTLAWSVLNDVVMGELLIKFIPPVFDSACPAVCLSS
jgi:hypothetical protein